MRINNYVDVSINTENDCIFLVSSLILPRLVPLMLELVMVMLLRLLGLKGFIFFVLS